MINRRIWSVLIVFAALVFSIGANAQNLAVKTNLLYDASTTPNIGVELGLGRKTTAQVFYGYNPWKYSGSGADAKKAMHWVVMPELRWWTCTKMNGWFYGVHAMGGQFNAANVNAPSPGVFFNGADIIKAVRDNRVEGAFAGGGVTVGYQWILSRHFNLEAEVGAGYNRIWYEKYPCAECGTRLEKASSNYAGITKAGLSIMYIF